MKKIKIIISGGGTGGHIYPAISIGNALKNKIKDVEILFVGAQGKMEMEKVPAAGYPIIGLPIRGFQRKLSLENLKFFFRLLASLRKARRIVKDFRPHAVVGVGGYASGPLLQSASKLGVPALIQEQNSYPGVTNKLLARKVEKICVAYPTMERFFPKEKIIFTGNPVREDLLDVDQKRAEGITHFGLQNGKKTLLILGGSLGARTINQSVLSKLQTIKDSDVQIVWQTGKFYYKEAMDRLKDWDIPNLKVFDFLSRMDLAYGVADLVISRAGAGTISELCLVGKPSVLVPSPNVSEDHQTKNAMALVHQQAALMVRDKDAVETLMDQTLNWISEEQKLTLLSQNIKTLAMPEAAQHIAQEIIKMIEHHDNK